MIKKLIVCAASLRVCIILLALLGIISIVGICIPQGLPRDHYLHLYGKFWGTCCVWTGGNHLFTSSIFYCIAGLFSVNILFCIVNRSYGIIREIRHPLHDIAGKIPVHPPLTFTSALSCEQAQQSLVSILREFRYSLTLHPSETGRTIHAHKGSLRRYGLLLVHCAVLVIIAGGFVSRFYSWEKPAVLAPQETCPIPQKNLRFKMKECRIVRDAQGNVVNYRTDIAVLSENGASGAELYTEVNHPAVYEGLRIYQSSYCYAPDTIAGVSLQTAQHPGDTVSAPVTLGMHQEKPVPETGLTMSIDSFMCDFAFDFETRRVVSRSQQHNNPAILIRLFQNDTLAYSRWYFLAIANKPGQEEPCVIIPVSYDPVYSSGLLFKYDPGTPCIEAGIVLMSSGLLLIFLIPFRQCFIQLAPRDGGCTVVISFSGAQQSLWKKEQSIISSLFTKV